MCSDSKRPLVDTNVLLYTVDEDPASASKRQRAQQLLLTASWGWPVQLAAAILAAAKQLGRHTVFSEDLNAGQNYEGVTVVNPFADMIL